MGENLENLAQTHYENFPVGSFLIPREFRNVVHRIYAFARTADDLADEGERSTEERLRLLGEWEGLLRKHLSGEGADGFFADLAKDVRTYGLDPRSLSELITAFRMDAEGRRYRTFDELRGYCRYSAEPVGRLMLDLFRGRSEENDRMSDDICTALQLTNFWQDISVDTARNRLYIPRDELTGFGLSEEDLRNGTETERFTALMRFQVERTRGLFMAGRPLIGRVPERFRKELSLTWHGGMRVLHRIERMGFDTRRRRPALTVFDKAAILFTTLRD